MSAPPEVPRNLLALKSMVIAMALLLVVCAAILVGVGISRMSGTEAFDPVSLPLPAGCEIASVTAEGDRLVIAIGGTDIAGGAPCRRILIADMESGKVTGEIGFPPE